MTERLQVYKCNVCASLRVDRYSYFPSQARKEGYEQIAAIFQETADKRERAR